MKYTEEVIIDLPRARVIEIFDDPENLPKWQTGLQSFELVSGEAGQPGAKSKLVYDMNGRRIEMIETIVRRDLPDEFTGTYEARGVKNWVANKFEELGATQTRWVTENEFQFSGLMILMGFFMRGSFPKQTREEMHKFKQFAESQGVGA
jgi:uncharacterized membrane protein